MGRVIPRLTPGAFMGRAIPRLAPGLLWIHTSPERERWDDAASHTSPQRGWDGTSQPLGPVARGIAFGDEPGDSLAGPLTVGERGVKRGTDDLLKPLATEFEVHQKIAV